MSRIRLNDIVLRNLTSPGGQKLFIDDTLANFGVRVSEKGTKSFVVVLPDRRYKTIGRYPQMGLRAARTEAKAILYNPTPSNRVVGLPEALKAFISDCETRLRPATVQFYRSLLSGYTEWPNTETDPHRIRALKVFTNWCIDNGFRTDNPYLRLKAPQTARDRVLSDDEIVAIWRHNRPPFSDILKVLILTGQRRGQFTSFDHSWVQGDEVHFPSSLMKSKRPHIIPLTERAGKITSQLTPFNGWGKSKNRLDKESEVADWVIHDLRRYFSSTMARLGVPLHITEQILDHRSTVSGVAAVYNRYQFIPEMRDALLKYEAHVATLVSAKAKL